MAGKETWAAIKGAVRGARQSIPIIGSTIDTVRKLAPQLEDEVTVEVRGEPGSEKQELYFLALAAANGEVRRFSQFSNGLAQTFGMIMIEFDQAEAWVRVTLRYKTSMLAANRSNVSIPLPRPGSFFDNIAIYRGPSCEVVGDEFDFIESEKLFGLGIPASSRTPDAPNGSNGLPFAAQTILTPCPTTIPPVPRAIIQNPVPIAPKANNGAEIPSPNPKPVGDNRSRGAVITSPTGTPPSGMPPTGTTGVGPCCPKTLSLIPLVFAALSAPATSTNMSFQAPVQGPTGG